MNKTKLRSILAKSFQVTLSPAEFKALSATQLQDMVNAHETAAVSTASLPLGFTGTSVIITTPVVITTTTTTVNPFKDAMELVLTVKTAPVYIHCITNNNVYKIIGGSIKANKYIIIVAKREDVISKNNVVSEFDSALLGRTHIVITAVKVKELVTAKLDALLVATLAKEKAQSEFVSVKSKFIVNIDKNKNLSVYDLDAKKHSSALPGDTMKAFFRQYDTIIAGVKATITITDDIKPATTRKVV